jgi:hypothetical protein
MDQYPPLSQLGGYASPGMPQNDQQAPQQFAQASPIQMRPLGNGQVQVINIRTGQVLYTGSPAGASNYQAGAAQQIRRIE